MSGSTGSPRSTVDRAARVQRLKAAVAARKQARDQRESTKGERRTTATTANRRVA